MGARGIPRVLLAAVLVAMSLPQPTHGMIEGLYCGKENCYDGESATQFQSTSGDMVDEE
jgi:hypothetical protein